MDYRKLTAPCGIDCFNCPLYKDNVNPALQERIGTAMKIDPGAVHCGGCRETGCFMLPGGCDTKACADKKNVEFCFECDAFPCAKLQPIAEGAATYPHNFKLYNLCRIEKVGLDTWAEEAADIRRRYFKGKFAIGKGGEAESGTREDR